MTDSLITFRGWQLFPDKEKTEQTYEELKHSGAESCGCEYCKNFMAQRGTAFPKDIKDLLLALGINYKKEIEVSHFAKLENGLHYYNGWFQFKGSFKGKDCTVPLPNGGYSTDMTMITDTFSIGFCYGNSLTPFKEKDGLVQIEFDCYLPWVLSTESK